MFKKLKEMFSSQDSSKNIAKERLQLVLVHDRSDCSPELINRIKQDIMKTLSEYVEINESEFDIEITRDRKKGSEKSTLVANIPINKLERIR
ncbi:MAG TPA: cell division topological specificity factor MinE [Clostridia bacterium]|jgi:cell division topological specificity factor|nr:cell division topological specificity factor MinE [Clostridia bacterium]